MRVEPSPAETELTVSSAYQRSTPNPAAISFYDMVPKLFYGIQTLYPLDSPSAASVSSVTSSNFPV